MKKSVKKKAVAKKKVVAKKKLVTKKKVLSKKKVVSKKKAVAKKAVATKKKATSKKKVAAKKTVSGTAPVTKALVRAKKAYTKTEVLNTIAERTGVSRKEVSAVLDGLGDVIECHVKKGAVGHFNLPGLLKIKSIRKPATKKRKGTNPFTGEETIFKAKPARNVVKILPLKKLKEMVV